MQRKVYISSERLIICYIIFKQQFKFADLFNKFFMNILRDVADGGFPLLFTSLLLLMDLFNLVQQQLITTLLAAEALKSL